MSLMLAQLCRRIFEVSAERQSFTGQIDLLGNAMHMLETAGVAAA